MDKDLLKDTFALYSDNQGKVRDVALRLADLASAFSDSEHGVNFRLTEPPSDSKRNRQSFIIETIDPDANHQTNEQMEVEIFAEGRATVTASWEREGYPKSGDREERTVYFSSNENTDQVTAKILAAMSDMAQSELSTSLNGYVSSIVEADGMEVRQ